MRLFLLAILVILLSVARSEAQSFPPWSMPLASGWANEKQATVLTDMTRATPSSALSTQMKHGRWKTIPYELTTGLKGTMVWTSPMAKAPSLQMKLGAKGWHVIFVGLFSGASATRVWLKLNTDPAPLHRANSNRDYYGNLRDTFFKVVELKGDESLVMTPQSSGLASACGVGYVKLIPLAAHEIAGFKAERADRSTRKMTVTCDGFSFMYDRRPTTAESLLAEVEELRDSDVETLILQQFGGDKVSYPSAVGHLPGLQRNDFVEEGHRNFAESVRELARRKINPVKVIIDGAHALGIKVQVGIRPAGWSWAEPYTELWESPFYKKHPEWRCIDRDGTPTTRLSWAIPEVRRHMIDLLMEMVRFGADGANIVFNRGLPVVLYEEPFCKQFRDQHNLDARTLDDTEPRIARLRADIVTTFMRELRAALDAEEKRRQDGKRLVISAVVLGNEFDNAWYGVDVRRLVNDGLLNEIMIYPFDFGARKGGYDLAFFRDVCKPRGVPFRAAGAYDTRKMLEFAETHYKDGSDGIAIWDGVGRDIDEWLLLARMGHVSELPARLKTDLPRSRYFYFRRLGDNVMDGRFSPIWGG
jgi:hypothetical protein